METVLTGRNLLSPVLSTAAVDVEAFDAKVTAANGRAAESSTTSARVQETAAQKVAASNVRTAESSSASSAKVVESNARAAESTRAFADMSESSAARHGVAWGSLATKGPALAAAAVAAAGVVMGKMAGDYQSALTRLSTTAGESQGNLKMVGQGMLDMAGQVGVGAQELAKGMYVVDSAGIHGADSLVVLKAAAQGARQENADLSHVVDAVTTSLHDFHLPASDAAKVTSELIAAVSHGKTTFDELTGSMHSIEPVAVGAGLNIAQTAGALAAMTASGMHADQAAQNLAHTIGSFQGSMTKPMRDELFQLGLDATDLQQHMGERGIAGTLQLIADRIRSQVDPSGHLLLNALQTNKTAVSDLSIMIGKMPPQLADMATGLLAGTASQKDFRKAAQDLGGEAGAMADQFLASYKGADGFSAALKSGGPMVQTYISALAKATGTADGLRTALQLTGENAGSTNDAIAAVGKASGDAKGNIEGWSQVQGNFNQKLAQAGAEAKSLAIEAGQHVLPVLTSMVSWVGTTGLPAISSLGHGIGDLVHDFSELPGPIKTVAEVLGGLALAKAVGVFGAIGKGVGVLSGALGGLGKAVSSIAGFKAAAGSVVDFFGGPLVLGITAGVGAITSMVSASNHQIADWAKSLEYGGTAAQQASKQMEDAHSRSILSANSLSDAWGIVKGAFTDGLAQIEGYSSALDKATQQQQGYYDHLSSAEKITYNVQQAQANLNDAIANSGPKSDAAKWAAFEYNQALGDQKTAQQNLDIATRGANGAFQDRISLQQQLAQGGVSLDQATLNTKQTIDQYKKSLKDANLTEDDHKLALDGVSQSMFGVMDAAKKQADLETTGLPIQMVHNQEIVRQRDALNQVVDQLGFVPPALQGMYDSLNGPTAKALQATKTNIDNIGTGMTTVVNNDVPGMMKALNDLAVASGSTFPQAVTGGFLPAAKGAGDAITQTGGLADSNGQKVSMFGQIISGLPPSHNTTITADTTQAQNTIDAFLANVKAKGFVGAVFNVGSPVGSGAQTGGLIGVPPVRKALGGAISGPGSGTSDSVLIAASNGEHMWTAAETAAAGGHAGVEALRKAVLARGGGRAAGGPIYPVDWSKSVQDGWAASLAKATTFSGGGGGAGSPLIRALGQNIANAMGFGSQFPAIDFVFSHESGWNPNAQNPTSSAYGIPQFLSSTWAQYGGKTSDPSTQIRDGIRYMVDRYGSPNGAAAFWQGHHWYDQGTNYVPSDQLAVLHRGEAVVPASQNQGAPYSPAAMPGYGRGGVSSYGGQQVVVVEKRTEIKVDATGFNADQIAAKVTARQHEHEFLTGG